VKIDRIDLSKRDMSAWRFCQKCSHTEQEATTQSSANCPKCEDEMWGDTGSRHPVIALRSVLAVTEEQKAAIQDSDDRNQRQHDRAIIPSYHEEAIGASWLATGEKDSVPFGFEFISPCEFRDFNFGEVASAPVGPRIAGEERRSRAFPVCKHCGRVQGRRRNEDDNGDHQPRCPVVKSGEEIPREDWERKVFLMREFSTETIRIIVPVVGQANHDDIKSFVSAINLGMRKHFSGKVDHIRSAVVETHLDELVTVRSLYLYDSVPGGSGYLRQLVEHPDSMKSVISKAEEALQSCPCVEDGKTGCYRCVKSYRSQFGPGEPDRDAALQMMQAILKQWEHLGRATRGINASVKDYLVDSQLEQRFMEVIHKRFGAQSLTPQVLEGGKKGFLLDTGLGGKGALWTVETQVQIDKRFKGLPKKRVDFLMTPIGSSGVKPIVVEMDGLTFHAETVDQDIIDRINMIRSGKVRVWTLGWHDLDEAADSAVSNPFSEGALGPAHAGLLGRILATPKLSPHEAGIKILSGATSLEGLFQAISNPALELSAAASILLRVIIQKGSAIDGLPRIASLTQDSRLFLEAAALHGHCGAGAVDCYMAADKCHPDEWHAGGAEMRVVLKTTLPGLVAKAAPTRAYAEAWRSLWRIVNMLQDLRGFHIEFPGIDTLNAPSMGLSSEPGDDDSWVEILELVDEAYLPLVRALIAAEIMPPDAIGLDLVEAGAVAGMAEVGWTVAKLAIAEQPLTISGWTVIHFDPHSPGPNSPISDVVAQLIEIIEGQSK
jgi:DEAD/DEAH box helicase domain-containing protein